MHSSRFAFWSVQTQQGFTFGFSDVLRSEPILAAVGGAIIPCVS